MGSKPRSGWGRWVAMFAAWLTAFQLAFATAPAPAAERAGYVPGQFFICGHRAGGGSERPGRPVTPAHMPDCCPLDCPMSGNLLTSPIEVSPLPVRVRSALRRPLVPDADRRDLRAKGSPRLSRGPPSAA